MKRKSKIRVKESSRNIFADLGFANPEREELKARLTLQIYRLIKERDLTQAQAGEVLGIKQPHVSSLNESSGKGDVGTIAHYLALFTSYSTGR